MNDALVIGQDPAEPPRRTVRRSVPLQRKIAHFWAPGRCLQRRSMAAGLPGCDVVPRSCIGSAGRPHHEAKRCLGNTKGLLTVAGGIPAQLRFQTLSWEDPNMPSARSTSCAARNAWCLVLGRAAVHGGVSQYLLDLRGSGPQSTADPYKRRTPRNRHPAEVGCQHGRGLEVDGNRRHVVSVCRFGARKDLQGFEDAADRGCADPMAELEELAVDGRLFRGARGGPLQPETRHGRIWHQAHSAAAATRSPASTSNKPSTPANGPPLAHKNRRGRQESCPSCVVPQLDSTGHSWTMTSTQIRLDVCDLRKCRPGSRLMDHGPGRPMPGAGPIRR